MRYFLCAAAVLCHAASPVLGAEAAGRIIIQADESLGPAVSLGYHVAVQGYPYNHDDPVETAFWRRLGPRSEGLALIADADYFGTAIHFRRAKKEDLPDVAAGRPSWRGPFGPGRDIWMDTGDFDAHREFIKARLGLSGEKVFFNLGATPRFLSFNAESDQHMHMSPVNYAEWEAVVEAAVRYLAETGAASPVIFGPDTEPESYFLGKNRAKEDRQAIARDFAELFVHSFHAVKRANPKAKLIGTGNVIYSGKLTGEVQGSSDQWGTEDFLRYVHDIDPGLRMEGFAVQGYFWRGLDGYGEDRLLVGARFIAEQLALYGHPKNIPQYILGWNPVTYNHEFDDSSFFVPGVTPFYQNVMDKLGTLVVSEAIRHANPGGERLIDTAFFYTWNGDGTPGCQGGFARGNLVSTVHEGGKAGEDGTFAYPDCFMLPSEVACTRAPYESMMFLKEVSQGDFIRLQSDVNARDLKAVAVRQGDAVKLLAAHPRHLLLSGLRVEILGLRPSGAYRARFRAITSDERLCAVIREIQGDSFTADSEGRIEFGVPDGMPMFLCVLDPLSNLEAEA